jgi:hypothetical protein
LILLYGLTRRSFVAEYSLKSAPGSASSKRSDHVTADGFAAHALDTFALR